jgi:predicted  nucleic acid-binding Zn-ribbon protein
VRIRPQVFQEIRRNDRIIACDACQRILYDPENLDHPFEVA